jgi:hypothetical protein
MEGWILIQIQPGRQLEGEILCLEQPKGKYQLPPDQIK